MATEQSNWLEGVTITEDSRLHAPEEFQGVMVDVMTSEVAADAAAVLTLMTKFRLNGTFLVGDEEGKKVSTPVLDVRGVIKYEAVEAVESALLTGEYGDRMPEFLWRQLAWLGLRTQIVDINEGFVDERVEENLRVIDRWADNIGLRRNPDLMFKLGIELDQAGLLALIDKRMGGSSDILLYMQNRVVDGREAIREVAQDRGEILKLVGAYLNGDAYGDIDPVAILERRLGLWPLFAGIYDSLDEASRYGFDSILSGRVNQAREEWAEDQEAVRFWNTGGRAIWAVPNYA